MDRTEALEDCEENLETLQKQAKELKFDNEYLNDEIFKAQELLDNYDLKIEELNKIIQVLTEEVKTKNAL